MLTFAQITAIIGLLVAFNAPANQVADIQRILLNVGTPSVQTVAPDVVIAPQVTEPIITQPPKTSLIAGSGAPVTAYADIKANGSDGPITITSGSIPTISWTSMGTVFPGCGISGGPEWSGNFGTNGSKPAAVGMGISTTTTFNISCETTNGKVADSVVINVQ